MHVACSLFFFFNDTATTEIYTLSLHDALPISEIPASEQEMYEAALQYVRKVSGYRKPSRANSAAFDAAVDRKSTRLNSSHQIISYAVFCLKKKKKSTSQ